jgi:acyl-CoA synthetase (NDP forming)
MADSADGGAPDLAAIRAIASAARRAGRTTLLEPEGLDVLAAAGIAVPRWLFVRDAEGLDGSEPGGALVLTGGEPGDAGAPSGAGPRGVGLTGAVLDELPGARVVVKVVSSHVAHKTEVGGVAIVPRDRAAVAGAIRAMGTRLGDAAEGYLIAEHVEHDAALGGELLLSLRWTDDFGAVVSVGAGGIQAEALAADLRPGREIAIVSPSLTPPGAIGPVLAAATAVRLATSPLRGQPPRLPLAHLVEVVGRLLAVGEALAPAELHECEINPAAVTADGLVALDVLVTLGDGPASVRPPRPVHKLARLLEPRSVAIVGVSSTSNPGRVILGNLVHEGFARDRIVVVKPGVDEIDGVRCVPDLAALPGKVDLFVIALSAAQAPAFVAEVIERDLAESLIVIPAGFEEKRGGGDLAARMRDALAAARARPDGGPLINGGNCLGIRSRPGRYDTLFIPRWKLPAGSQAAPIALITGSGAFAVTRLSRLGRLDPRYVVTVGNQMDLTVGDYLAHLADDPAVRVFGVYVEGFAPLDGVRFLEAAARITAGGRTVLLYRAGRTSAGARASASHTAAIAGDATVTRELARAAGVLVAETPAAFDDLLRTFTLLDGRIARGRRLGAVSNAGSECVTIADHLGPLQLPAFSPATEAGLAAILGPAGIDAVVDVHNPLDLTPIADGAIYEAVARTVLEADEVDVGLVGIVPVTDTLDALPAGPGHPEDLARPDAVAARLARLWRETTKPWVAVVDAGPLYDPFTARLAAAGIPTFGTADAATRALAAFCDAAIGRG